MLARRQRFSKVAVQLVALLAGAALLHACGGNNPNKKRDDLVKEWKGIAEAALKNTHQPADIQRATDIGLQLAQLGPTGIDPLLEILADPKTNPRTKVLVTISLTTAIAKENVSKIVALTDARYDVNTRVNATHLIASLGDPDLDPRCNELMKDPEPRVRLQVFHMRLMSGNPEALALMDSFWNDPATPVNDRSQIILGTPESEVPKHMNIFAEAATNAQIERKARDRAITELGRLGDASVLPVLQKAADSDTDLELRKSAKAALDAAKSRLDGSAVPVPTESAPQEAATAEPAATPPSAGSRSAIARGL